MYAARIALDAGLGSEIGKRGKRRDVLGTAIGVAAVVQRIDTDEKVLGMQDLGPRQGERQHDGVARGDVGHRDAVRRRLRNRNGLVGKGGTADLGQVDVHDSMLARPQGRGDTGRRLQLDGVPLAVGH